MKSKILQSPAGAGGADPQSPIIDEKTLLARFLPVSKKTLQNWRKRGLIPSIKLDVGRPGRVLYDLESVLTALRRHQRGGE